MITRRLVRTIQSTALLVLLMGCLAVAWQAGWLQNPFARLKDSGTYRVSQFYDGDTIGVMMEGKEEKIRMIGVDTPETHRPDTPVQCYGEAAATYTKQLINSQPITLEADPLSTNRDRYDRLLRYVYLPDGRDVNALLIEQGYGFAYTSFPFTKTAHYLANQLAAQHQKRGLWQSCQPYIVDGRWQSNNAK